MSAIKLDSENFEREVLRSDVPVLVDFWASWCGPCKMLSPVIEEISNEAEGFKVASLNIDDEMALAQQYRVQSIPTLLVFKNGEPVRRSVGVIGKQAVLDLVK